MVQEGEEAGVGQGGLDGNFLAGGRQALGGGGQNLEDVGDVGVGVCGGCLLAIMTPEQLPCHSAPFPLPPSSTHA